MQKVLTGKEREGTSQGTDVSKGIEAGADQCVPLTTCMYSYYRHCFSSSNYLL